MLPSNAASCTSPTPNTDNPDKKVQWASEKRRRISSTDSESKTHVDPSKLPRSRRPSRLTVKYDRSELQRWLEMEQWVDAQIQELFQTPQGKSCQAKEKDSNPYDHMLFPNRMNKSLLSPRLIWKLSWNYPPRSRKLSWRLFSKAAPAPQSLLSLSCSANSRNFGDSADLQNKPRETVFSSLSTAGPVLALWILAERETFWNTNKESRRQGGTFIQPECVCSHS
ncbi:protein phosphatase 1 regulatory subunit 14D isoform X1 [Nannospalax galili]|uniref:protein phosphatase 1 regulatory subunit 14D isoform X1 n=1 Tax=Nannospalax galili TaxID=1026970 RepID=UPI0004ED1A56|nr:protein phosphatase 1 regulatory subunit 14D isoform X1 [Nannospalax galili]